MPAAPETVDVLFLVNEITSRDRLAQFADCDAETFDQHFAILKNIFAGHGIYEHTDMSDGEPRTRRYEVVGSRTTMQHAAHYISNRIHETTGASPLHYHFITQASVLPYIAEEDLDKYNALTFDTADTTDQLAGKIEHLGYFLKGRDTATRTKHARNLQCFLASKERLLHIQQGVPIGEDAETSFAHDTQTEAGQATHNDIKLLSRALQML